MAPRAAARLESLGFEQVFEYRGGKLDWLAAGKPTEGENSKRPRAGDVARRDAITCGLNDRLGDVRKRAAAAGWDVAVGVRDRRLLLRMLGGSELGEKASLA